MQAQGLVQAQKEALLLVLLSALKQPPCPINLLWTFQNPRVARLREAKVAEALSRVRLRVVCPSAGRPTLSAATW